MVYESTKDATFSIRYDRAPDRFTIKDSNERPIHSAARLELGENGDFILFDNDVPGALRFATHSGRNKLAAKTLAMSVFNNEYIILSESVREGAGIYDFDRRTVIATVEYSNQRRLARIALHASADGASQAVKELHARIIAPSENGAFDEGPQPLT